MFVQRKFAMLVAELLGTLVLALTMYSMLARTSFPMFSGIAAGGTVALMLLVFGNASGGHYNPAITLGLWTIRKVKTLDGVIHIVGQILGGLAAWALIRYFLGHSITSIAGKFEWKVFVAEAVGTLVFAMAWAAVFYERFVGARVAGVVGTALLLGILVASLASNGILNPAVAVGVQSWNWAYAVAPLVGGIVGANLYWVIFGVLPAERAVAASRSGATVTPSRTTRTTSRSSRTTKRRTTRRR